MTAIELINIVAKKAGIRESEAKFFFELFIKRLSDKMKPGESVKFSDVGFFHLRFTNRNVGSGEDEIASSEKNKINVMLFSTQLEQADELENNIIFNIHNIPGAERDEIDSYFSLSVGKPVFPVEGVTNGELFNQQNRTEIRKSLLSNAEQLVNSVEKLSGVIGEKEIVLEKSLLSKRKSELLKADALFDETPISGEDSFPDPENIRNRAPDFDEYISGKIKKEKNVEPGKEVKPEANEDEGNSEKLPWNFGREVFDKKVDYKNEESDDVLSKDKEDKLEDKEEPDEETKAGKLPVELAESSEDGPKTFSLDEEIDTDKTDLGTEPKEDLTEKEIEHDEKLKSILDEYITKNEPEKFGAYKRVKSFVSDIKKDKKSVDKTEEEVEKELVEFEEETLEDEFKEVQSKLSEYHLEDEKAKLKKEKETVPDKKSNKKDKYLYKRKKRNIVPFLVALFAIVFVVAIVYLYLESDTIFKSDKVEENVLPIVRPASVNVIERKYDFPVTYPYSAAETGEKISGINLGLFSDEKIVFKPPVPKQEMEKRKKEKSAVSENEQKTGSKNIGSVGKNVYKYKDYYVVQVASFKSYSVAEEEAKKYEDLGYNTFVEIAEITDKGTWFRLRVGDFTTREKANSFANKYIK